MNVDLENDIDRLYVAPREEFVRERDALVKTLRAAGDREAAAEVGAIRKPTLVAWTVNQLAHMERRDVDLLLDAGKRIIDAQEAYRCGYLQKVVPAADLDSAVEKMIGSILLGGPHAMRLQKALVRDWQRMSVADSVRQGIRACVAARSTDEPKRMMEAFINRKRK